jgi:lysozyme
MWGAKQEQLRVQPAEASTKDQSQAGSAASNEAQDLAKSAQAKQRQKTPRPAPKLAPEVASQLPPGAAGLQLGFDVFHGDVYGSYPNFSQLKANGMRFMFAKAIEGTSSLDKTFEKNFASAKKAGLICGAYDFFHPEEDATKQAQAFLKTLPALQKGDLVALDLEGDNWQKVPQADRIKGVMTWLNIVEKELNITPIVYMNKTFAGETFGKDAEQLRDYPLWEAEYKVNNPTVPPPFTNEAIWQFSETGTFPGLGGHQNDLNVYSGKVKLSNLSRSLRVKASQNIPQRAPTGS